MRMIEKLTRALKAAVNVAGITGAFAGLLSLLAGVVVRLRSAAVEAADGVRAAWTVGMRRGLCALALVFVTGICFAEQKTGKVVSIKENTFFTLVFVDSDADKIIDAIFEMSNEFPDIMLPKYIKIGSTIVYSFDMDSVDGVFRGGSDSIVSIDGKPKAAFFPYKLKQ